MGSIGVELSLHRDLCYRLLAIPSILCAKSPISTWTRSLGLDRGSKHQSLNFLLIRTTIFSLLFFELALNSHAIILRLGRIKSWNKLQLNLRFPTSLNGYNFLVIKVIFLSAALRWLKGLSDFSSVVPRYL